VGAGFLGITLGAMSAPLGFALVGAATIVGGGYALSRAIYRTAARSRLQRLEDLADRLAEQCEELAE
jgi:hypothetical protein